MHKSREIKLYEDGNAVAKAFAEKLVEIATSNKQTMHIALSGGTTPTLLFDILASEYSKKMPWNRIHFWWGDERCVPPTDNESNFKMTNDHLFRKIDINPNQIHRVKSELSPEKAKDYYISEIKQNLETQNGIPVFDLIILGMGNDGHTASIFPDQLDLLNSNTICAVATHPESGQKRITLTGKIINNAKLISFLVTGKSKADRIAEIFNNVEEAKKLPTYYIQPENGKLIFLLDKEAAAGIESPI